MKYILEIYYQGECLEHREQTDPYVPPSVGEQVYLEFDNPNVSDEHGHWWIVRRRRHLLFSTQMQTLMLDCEPDPDKGR